LSLMKPKGHRSLLVSILRGVLALSDERPSPATPHSDHHPTREGRALCLALPRRQCLSVPNFCVSRPVKGDMLLHWKMKKPCTAEDGASPNFSMHGNGGSWGTGRQSNRISRRYDPKTKPRSSEQTPGLLGREDAGSGASYPSSLCCTTKEEL